MESLTKASVTEEEIHDLVRKVLGWEESQMKLKALKGGCFNLSYRVELEKGEAVIIKIGPPAEVELLSYESDMMSTELWIHHLIEENPQVRVPRILYSDLSCEIIPYPFFIMSALKGCPLNTLENVPEKDKVKIYKTLARFMAEIHRIKGDHFGYALMRDELKEKDYFQAYLHMVQVILSDGKKRHIRLPVEEERLLECIHRHQNAFAEVKEAVLVHYDLWAGNLFVDQNKQGEWELEAIIDFERGFYGDPAADFIQVLAHVDLEKDSWFLEEYNRVAEKPFELTDEAKNRVDLFWMYLCLIMVIESYYRDVAGSFTEQRIWAEKELVKVLIKLEGKA